MKYTILFVGLLLLSCGNQRDKNDLEAPDNVPSKSMTLWTETTELFVEFPALVVNSPSRFAAHFTVLDKHQPVRDGSVTVSLIKGEKGLRNTVQSPSSPGIFSPTLQPKEAGNYKLVFNITTPTYSDTLTIHDIIVYATKEDAINALGSTSADGGISFLKEQAWKIDFQTSPIVSGEIYNVINTSGVWMPSSGSVKSLVAKSNGIVNFAVNNLTEGTEVKRGQLLLNISSQGLVSNNLSAEVVQAKADLELATSEYERKKQLYEAEIIPKAEFDKVAHNFTAATSNYETLSTGVSDKGKQIRAPFDGFIKSIRVGNGDYVSQGAALVSIGSHQSRVLQSQVSPSYGLTMQNVVGIWYQSKEGTWSNVNEAQGEILSIGKDVDMTNPLISVFAQVNAVVEMPEGSLTPVQITMGEARENIIIPINALLENYGEYSVVVQLTGESFDRRTVKLGKRNGEYVEIIDGLKLGEVLVTKGAYQIKMASMSGSTPAHGHEH